MKLIFVFALGLSAFAQTPCEQPLPLEPGAKVVPLCPAGSSMLHNCNEREVLTPTKDDPSRIQKVVNIHNARGESQGFNSILSVFYDSTQEGLRITAGNQPP